MSGFSGTQMIFSSNVGFSEKEKTVVLSLDDFSKTEYDKTANGLILDETEMNLTGFISSNNDKFKCSMGRSSILRLNTAMPLANVC
jgi:hypothetical protein